MKPPKETVWPGTAGVSSRTPGSWTGVADVVVTTSCVTTGAGASKRAWTVPVTVMPVVAVTEYSTPTGSTERASGTKVTRPPARVKTPAFGRVTESPEAETVPGPDWCAVKRREPGTNAAA